MKAISVICLVKILSLFPFAVFPDNLPPEGNCFSFRPATPASRSASALNSGPGGAFEYLDSVMDRYHDVFFVYLDDYCGGNHYIPSGWMGDMDIDFNGNHTADVYSDVSSIEIDYRAVEGGENGWAGIYWQYPENNWGDRGAGYDLTGATTLRFAARGKLGGEKVEFKMGGINRNPFHNPSFPHQDSCDLLSTGLVTLTDTWREYTIDLAGREYFSVYRDQNSGSNNRYFPSGWLNGPDNMAFDDAWADNPHSGETCIRVEWNGAVGGDGTKWNGIAWQFPENNWEGGQGKGYDLSGAAKLTFYGRTDEEGLEIKFWVGYPEDSCRENFVTGENDHFVRMSGGWTRYEIDLEGKDMSDVSCGFGFAFNDDHDPAQDGCVFYLDSIAFDNPLQKDLSNVLGGFCFAVDKAHNPDGCTFYLDDVKYDKASLQAPRFLRSYTYTAQPVDDTIRNTAYVYDNALALIAYSMPGTYLDLPRARQLADALVAAQRNDRHFSDGRLRNAYMSGDLIDPATGYARLPGWWDYDDECWYEDRSSVGTHTGNVAWAIIALVHYYHQHRGRRYLEAAFDMAGWIVANCHSDIGAGGFTGGYEGFEGEQEKLTWKSIEHNIDLYVAFSLLARWDGGWADHARHAWSFVEAMWNETTGHFWTGTQADGTTVNDTYHQIPLDAQAWAVLASPGSREYHRALDWAREHLWVEDLSCPQPISGYDFNPDLDGVWFEGVGQMGVAFQAIGAHARAAECLDALRSIQSEPFPCAGGGIPAACRDGLTTGFDWEYNARCCVAATCWYLFAEKAFNPYAPPDPRNLILGGGDYDGDGVSDIAIFREDSGLWAVRGVTRAYFGSAFDLPVSGDYDGDGTSAIGIFRSRSGLWAIRNLTRLYFGRASDIPTPEDYTGDGRCDVGIFRPSTGLWAIRGVTRLYFGRSGDTAIPGDYDGNGTTRIGIFRSGSGLWALWNVSRIYYGRSGDTAVPGDYDGDGTRHPGVFRPSSGLWAARAVTRLYFGGGADLPVPSDYNGDGTDNAAIFRDHSGLWAIRRLSRTYFGRNNDIPVTR